MADTVHCSRCGRDAAALPAPPLPGDAGIEVQQKVCADCWAEWQNMEVMVINELRLNFMDPDAQETLERHMREFFGLATPSQPGLFDQADPGGPGGPGGPANPAEPATPADRPKPGDAEPGDTEPGGG